MRKILMNKENYIRVDDLVKRLNEDNSWEHENYHIKRLESYTWEIDFVHYSPGGWQLYLGKNVVGGFAFNDYEDKDSWNHPIVAEFYPRGECPWKTIVALREIMGQDI